MTKKLISRIVLATGAISIAVPVAASDVAGLDILREWNLVVLGDLDSTSEVEGRTFVSGDLNGQSSNYNIQSIPASTNGKPALTVVGDVNGNHKNINNGGGAIVGGNLNSGFNLNGDPQTVQVGGTISNTNINANTVTGNISASDPSFLMDLQQEASFIETSTNLLSQDLAGLTANSDFTANGNRGVFNAVPDADGLAVFSIDAADLNSIGEIEFNLNGADTAIVNVTGANITLNDNFLGGTNNLGENVVWNFHEADTLDLSTAWGGSVLAPTAAASTRNYIQGSAVFGSLDQDGEMHVGTFVGTYPGPASSSSSGGSTSSGGSSSGGSSSGGTAVPEPEFFGLFGLGLAGIYLMRRRRRRAA